MQVNLSLPRLGQNVIRLEVSVSIMDWLNARILTSTDLFRIKTTENFAVFGSKHRKIHFRKNPMFWSKSARKIAIAWPNPLF